MHETAACLVPVVEQKQNVLINEGRSGGHGERKRLLPPQWSPPHNCSPSATSGLEARKADSGQGLGCLKDRPKLDGEDRWLLFRVALALPVWPLNLSSGTSFLVSLLPTHQHTCACLHTCTLTHNAHAYTLTHQYTHAHASTHTHTAINYESAHTSISSCTLTCKLVNYIHPTINVCFYGCKKEQREERWEETESGSVLGLWAQTRWQRHSSWSSRSHIDSAVRESPFQ